MFITCIEKSMRNQLLDQPPHSQGEIVEGLLSFALRWELAVQLILCNLFVDGSVGKAAISSPRKIRDVICSDPRTQLSDKASIYTWKLYRWVDSLILVFFFQTRVLHTRSWDFSFVKVFQQHSWDVVAFVLWETDVWVNTGSVYNFSEQVAARWQLLMDIPWNLAALPLRIPEWTERTLHFILVACVVQTSFCQRRCKNWLVVAPAGVWGQSVGFKVLCVW